MLEKFDALTTETPVTNALITDTSPVHEQYTCHLGFFGGSYHVINYGVLRTHVRVRGRAGLTLAAVSPSPLAGRQPFLQKTRPSVRYGGTPVHC